MNIIQWQLLPVIECMIIDNYIFTWKREKVWTSEGMNKFKKKFIDSLNNKTNV